jgi:glycosyltransferase involved in cell wall biosynthesis
VKVAFDGACLGDGPVTGVGRAFLNGLAAYAAAFTNDAVLLLPAHAPRPPIAGLRIVEAPRGALRRQLALPRLLRQLGADVLHSPVAAVPLRARCPTIATVHDLPWFHSESGERTSWWRKFATRHSLRAAAAVLAPSRFTLHDAATLAGDPARVHLVPHGCDRRGDEPTAEDTAHRAGPFLVLGDDRPRKNRGAIAAAHELATARSPLVPPLRFVGPPAAWVGEDEKIRLLDTCCAVVHCARFEGFGLPVLEAIAHGAPVVCSDIAPLREIAGDDAVFVDPEDTESIAAGLCRVLEPALRTSLARNGWRRAAEFSTAVTAQRWRTLHEDLAR